MNAPDPEFAPAPAPAHEGLAEAEAARRLRTDGPNTLPKGERRTFWRVLVEVLVQPMFILLMVAAALYLALGDLGEGLTLSVAVFAVAGITIVQEARSEKAVTALRDLTSPRAQVLRDGVARTIASAELVSGDLIRVGEGDRVPADAVLREGVSLSADESILTGESVPVHKRTAPGERAMGPPGGDGTSWLYSGTLVVSGRGVAEVLATGARTEIGRIGASLKDIERQRTPLQREVSRLVRIMAVGGLALAVLVMILRGLESGEWIQAALAGLTIAMALLPEEFPVVLTLFLALGARRIARHGVLTRRTTAVETLGVIDVLCTDKTGTLTENRMTVGQLWSVSEPAPRAVQGLEELPEAVHELLEYAILACPRDPFDPMEKAFLALGRQTLADTEHLHAAWEDTREYPLTSELLAVTHVWRSGDSHLTAATKGAPAAVFDLCHLEPAPLALWSDRAATMAQSGLRVLGVARAVVPGEAPEHPHALAFAFVGLVGLVDPLRPDVPAAVAHCRKAGVRVVMITGDHVDTARAIAREAGIDSEHVLLGAELDALDDAGLEARVADVTIVARAVPQHKLRIVRAMQRRGLRVAMTGDGVNDAPALEAADIGVAMGKRGTDVARESAALVLVDDDFGAIVEAARVGRGIFDNMRRAFGYIVAVHIPVAGLALIPALLGWDALIGPIQVVFLELVIDPACTIVFELEPPDEAILDRPPRPPNEHLLALSRGLFSALQGFILLGAVLGLVLLLEAQGASEPLRRTAAFVTLVVGNLAILIASRSAREPFWRTLTRKNRALPILLSATLAFLALLVYLPPAAALVDFVPLGPLVLGLTLAFGITPILVLDAFEALVVSRWRGARLTR